MPRLVVDIAAVRALRAAGWSLARIAAWLGVSESGLRAACLRAGIPLPTRPRERDDQAEAQA